MKGSNVSSPSYHNGRLYWVHEKQGTFICLDAKTGEISIFEVPTKGSNPRRGQMDAQDRLWFAEWWGDKVAMFDTKSTEFKEWKLPLGWSNPYDVTVDKNGYAWTGSMLNDAPPAAWSARRPETAADRLPTQLPQARSHQASRRRRAARPSATSLPWHAGLAL